MQHPFSFPNGGTITFTGELSAAAELYKFENAPYPDVDPNFSTASVTVNGAAAEYSVEIPAQDAAQTFSSFLLYVTTLDQAVTLTNVTVTANAGDVVILVTQVIQVIQVILVRVQSCMKHLEELAHQMQIMNTHSQQEQKAGQAGSMTVQT